MFYLLVFCLPYFKKKYPSAQTIACPGCHVLALEEGVRIKGILLSFLLQLNTLTREILQTQTQEGRGKEVTIPEPTRSAENKRLLRTAHGRCRATLKQLCPRVQGTRIHSDPGH